MLVSPGPHTLHQTIGGTTVVTVTFDSTGFTAFDHRWTYNSSNGRYESEIGWLVFDGSGDPKVFAGIWNGIMVGGWWV
jgi:hypothetical protein